MQHTRLSFALILFAGALVLAATTSLMVGLTSSHPASPLAEPTLVGSSTVANPTVVYLVSPTVTKGSTKPTARPTVNSVHAYPTPQPTVPKPSPTACKSLYCNPWGYNFQCCVLIYNTPATFCNYFPCIRSFWEQDDPGDGYVVICGDGNYSQAGSELGQCAWNGGSAYVLYAPGPKPPTPTPTPTATPAPSPSPLPSPTP